MHRTCFAIGTGEGLMNLEGRSGRLPARLRGEVVRRMAGGSRFLGLVGSLYGHGDSSRVTAELRGRMRLDPQIALGLAAVKAPILGAFKSWRIECADGAIGGFLESALRPIARGLVRSCLNAVDFGHAPHEKVFEIADVEVSVQDSSGEMRERTFCGYAVYREVKDLDPRRVVYQCTEEGKFGGIRHNGDEVLGVEKSFVFTHGKEFGDIYGRSRLDAAYDAWYRGGAMELMWCRYMERKADPPLIGRAPGDVMQDEQGNEQSAISDLTVKMNSLRSGGGIVLPSAFDGDTKQALFDVKELETSDKGVEFRTICEYFDVKKLRAILVPERVLTQDTRVGTGAMAAAHTETFYRMSENLVADIEEHFNRYLIPDLIRYNFGVSGVRGARIRSAGVSVQDPGLLADILKTAMRCETTYRTALEKGDGKLAAEGRSMLIDLLDKTKVFESLNLPVRE